MRERISHELRTPLTVIKASIEHLLKRGDALDDQERRELLLGILVEVQMLEGAVQVAEALASRVDDSIAVVLDREESAAPGR